MKVFVKSFKRYIKNICMANTVIMKVCLCLTGVLVGLGVRKDKKRSAAAVAVAALFIGYMSVLRKFLNLYKEEKEDEDYILNEDCFEIID